MKIRKGRKAEQGFTLIELLVVVAIIALLAAVAVPSLIKAADKSYGARGKSDLQTVSAALDRFYMEQSFYPTDLHDLVVAGYMKTSDFKNGYGNPYFYAVNDVSVLESGWDPVNKKFATVGKATAYALGDPGKYAQNLGAATTCNLTQSSVNAAQDGSMCPMPQTPSTLAWSLWNDKSQGSYIITTTSSDGNTYPDSTSHSLKGFSKNIPTE